MKRYTEREVRDLLTLLEVPRPPADLVGLIKSEIPDSFDKPQGLPDAKKTNVIPFFRRPKARTYLLAASLTATLGGALFAHRVQQQMMPPANLTPASQEARPMERGTGAVLADQTAPTVSEISFEGSDAKPKAKKTPLPTPVASALLEKVEPKTEKVDLLVATTPSVLESAPSLLAGNSLLTRPSLQAGNGESETGVGLRRDRQTKFNERQQALTMETEAVGEMVEAEVPSGPRLSSLRANVVANMATRRQMVVDQAPYEDVYSRNYGTNIFIDTEDDALSTFDLDVDTASYTVMRRHLDDGRLPPPETVRVEELINYFDYGDAPPMEGDFAIHTEGAPSIFGEGEQYLLRFHLRGRFVENLTDTLQTIAAEARVQVQFNPEIVSRYRLVGYDRNIANIANERFRDETVDAGEIGAGHAVTALYEIELRGTEALRRDTEVATFRLRYGSIFSGEQVESVRTVSGKDMAEIWEESSAALRLTSLVAEFGEIMKQSFWAQSGSLDEVFRRTQLVGSEFPGHYEVAELVALIGKAARIQR